MILIYNISVRIYNFIILIASFFNPKASLWIQGRKDIFNKIQLAVNTQQGCIWFHFASLGEYEQGRPVLQSIRQQYPLKKIVITFFSPSGYEIRKNSAEADHVFYLPADTRSNAEKFIKIIKPDFAIFTKYEYWLNYFNVLNENKVPVYMVSSIFWKEQLFFKPWGGFYRKVLNCVTHFFVQNETSVELLKSLGHTNVTLSGDTRFDTVWKNKQQVKDLPLVKQFVSKNKIFIAGSTWPKDEILLKELINFSPENWKFIIAPHEINEKHIGDMQQTFGETAICYSKAKEIELNHKKILIIDNIGMLSSLYQYGQIAYIGGGFGKGIHNVLEAAVFELPVIIGPNFYKFQEAKDLINFGGAFKIENEHDLIAVFNQLNKAKSYQKASKITADYVKVNTGATAKIMAHLNTKHV